MPFIDDDKIQQEIGQGQIGNGRLVNSPDEVPELAPPVQEKDGFGGSIKDIGDKLNTYKAVIEDNTAIGSLLKYGVANKIINDPNYNVSEKIHGTPMEPYASEFVGIDNDHDLSQKTQDINTRLQHLDDMKRNPTTAGIAGLAAGILDPINAVPMMEFAKTGGLLTDALSGAALGSAYGAGFMGYTEAGISVSGEPLQESRESKLASVASGALLGGLLGTSIGALNGGQYTQLKNIVTGNLLNNTKFDGPTLAAQYDMAAVEKAIPKNETSNQMTDRLGLPKLQGRRILEHADKRLKDLGLDKNDYGIQYDIEKGQLELTKLATDETNGERIVEPLPKEILDAPAKYTPEQLKLIKDDFEAQANAVLHSDDSAGAMRALENPEMTKLANLGGDKTTAAAVRGLQIGGYLPGDMGKGLQSPVLRAAISPSDTVRSLNEKYFSFAAKLKKNTSEFDFQGTSKSVDELLTYDHGTLTIPFQEKLDDAYMKYLNRMREETKTSPNLGKPLSPTEFYSEAAISHWQGINDFKEGDVTYPQPHAIPEIEHAKSAWKELLETQNKRMDELGVMPENLTIPEKNYLSVVPDYQKISKDPIGFQKVVSDHWRSVGLPKNEAEAMAQQHLHDYLQTGDFRPMLRDVANLSLDKGIRFTKERQYMVPAWVMKDYLKTDLKQLGSMYSEQANRLVRMTQFLKENGLSSINDVGKMIDDEFADKLTKLQTSDLPKEIKTQKAAELTKQNQSEKLLAQEMSSIMSGSYLHRTSWDSKLSNLRTFTYWQMMGSMPLTAITHAGVAAIKYGLPTVLIQGYGKQLELLSKGLKNAKIEDLKNIDFALDRGMDHSLRSIFDPNLETEYSTPGQQLANRVTSVFNRVTGARALIGNQKYNVSLIAEHELTKNIMAYANLADKDKEYLANLHIDKTNIKMLQDQIKTHGMLMERDPNDPSGLGVMESKDPSKGSWFGNYASWDNPKAKQLMSLAMTKEGKTFVPSAGRGDGLFFGQRYAVGRQVLQFTNFFTTLTNQVLLRAMQDRDFHVLQGVISTMALGSVSYLLKEEIAGRTPNMSIENLIFQGMSRSAMLGLLTSPAFGAIGSALKNPSITGYWGQSGVESMLGPTAADIDDAFKLYRMGLSRIHAKNAIKAQKLDVNIAKQFGHMLPFQNLWILKGLINRAFPPKQKIVK